MRTVQTAALEPRPSQEALLHEFPLSYHDSDSIEMGDTNSAKTPVETQEDVSISNTNEGSASRGAAFADAQEDEAQPPVGPLRLYKRRFFGLFQLVLLNIIVSWDVSCSSYAYLVTLGLRVTCNSCLLANTVSSGLLSRPLRKHVLSTSM